MFSLNKKIEEIRQKPEHIRMRYVWAWLVICMIFVFSIWVFSVKENFSAVDFDKGSFPDIRSEEAGIKENIPSFGELKEASKKSISELESEIKKEP